MLSITVGSERHILGYYPADYDKIRIGSTHSIDRQVDNSNDIIPYFCQGHYLEGIREMTIDKVKTFETIVSFLKDQGLPNTIAWVND